MIGTFMGWLSDVEAGGATAFDFPGVEQLVYPTKGSAAFWWNLRSNHVRETKTSHGGCPVLAGSKWILNKWMYSFDQFLNYPCPAVKNVALPPFNKYY